MENLFMPVMSFGATEYHVLPEDSGEWPVEIMRKFYEQVPPDISSIPSKVVFTNKDESAKAATGSVSLQSNPQVTFPFVVKPKGNIPTVSPLDVFIVEGELYPYSPQMLMRKISTQTLNAKLGPKKKDNSGGRVGDLIDRGSSNQGLDSLLTPPSELGNVGAAYKFSSEGGMLANALYSATPTHLKEAFDAVSDDATRLAMETKHPSALGDIVDAIRSMDTGGVDAPVRVIQIRRLTSHGFPVKMLREGGLAEERYIQNIEGIKRLFSSLPNDQDSALSKLYSTGDYTWVRKTANEFIDSPETIEAVAESTLSDKVQGYVEVEAEDGSKTTGWLVSKVTDFDGNLQDASLFIGQDFGGYQESYTTRIIEKHPPLAESSVLEGKKGAFVSYESGMLFSTIPFDIKAVTITPTHPIIHVDTYEHGRLKLIPSKDAAIIIPAGDDTYFIPDYYRFMEIPSLRPIKSYGKTENLEMKAASEYNIMEVSCDNGHFTMSGYPAEKLQKFAGELYALGEKDAKFALCCAGYRPEDADRIIKKAHDESVAKLCMVNIEDPSELKKTAMTGASFMHTCTDGLRVNLFKEASVLDDGATVDTLLSLNFINPENVSMFVSSLPWLNLTLKILAKSVMAARLGMPIPEAPAKTAMKELLRVTEALENLAVT